MKLVKNTDHGAAGRAAERKAAKRMDAQLQPGSGALLGAKADFKLQAAAFPLLVENKTTTGKSFSLQLAHLHKVYQEALEQSRTPALSFQFVTGNGNSEKRGRWVAIPEADFLNLINPD